MATSNDYYIIRARRSQYQGAKQLELQLDYMRYLVRSLMVAKPRADAMGIDRTRGLWPQRRSAMGRKGALILKGVRLLKQPKE